MPMSKLPPEHAGWFEGKTHVLPVRVYYEDTDASGIVYHANYLRYCERGRSDFLRMAGVRHLLMMQGEDALAWTLRRFVIDFHKPGRLDDLLHVHTRYTELSGARISGHQRVLRGHDLLIEAQIEACIINLSGKARRIPQDVREKITPLMGEPWI
jgi:acyl-CoA thioester hydrolase